jgi:hypothetical protein
MISGPWSSRVIPHFAVINPICNLTTAKVLGVAIPATLVSTADEVIGQIFCCGVCRLKPGKRPSHRSYASRVRSG